MSSANAHQQTLTMFDHLAIAHDPGAQPRLLFVLQQPILSLIGASEHITSCYLLVATQQSSHVLRGVTIVYRSGG